MSILGAIHIGPLDHGKSSPRSSFSFECLKCKIPQQKSFCSCYFLPLFQGLAESYRDSIVTRKNISFLLVKSTSFIDKSKDTRVT